VTAQQVVLVSTGASSPAIDAGNANAGGVFRFDLSLGPGYIFNLKTTGLGTGIYSLTFTVSGIRVRTRRSSK